MASVFLARLAGVAGFQRLVAIKRLHPHLARETEFVQMFLDEARLAARIHDPHVVPILEIGTSEEGYYLVMEYIEGDTVARLLAKSSQAGKKIPVPVALRIALDALLGLHAAHELRDDDGNALELVHRDVSPQNILVGIDGLARITDFGVARAASRLATTKSGQLKGKLAYMAPEQARGQTVDRRTDIFPLGTILWEMLAQKRLFRGDAEAETLNRVLFEPIPTLRSADPSIPASLEAICVKALQREPGERYATAAEMADAVEQAGRSLGMLASTREVAAHVEAVIGTELSQQREAVRAWLSASEPSRNSSLSSPSFPSSGAASSSRARSMPVLGKGEGSESRPAARPASLSAATLALPAETSTGMAEGMAAPVPSTPLPALSLGPTRGSRARLGAAAIVVLCFAGAFAGLIWKHSAPAESAKATPPVSQQPVAEGASTPLAIAPVVREPAASDSSATFDSGAATSLASAPSTARPGHTTRKPSPKGTGAPLAVPSPPPPALPDDLSNNPYR